MTCKYMVLGFLGWGLLSFSFSQVPAFPSAEGFGRLAQGGRNGVVVKVTNLNDSGLGSLRYAVNLRQKRIIVFEVSGIIELKSPLIVTHPYCTIAGQTAPGDGITLKNYALIISASHVIIRYIRSRLGEMAGNSDAISVGSGTHIMIDHCSASWSVDETLSAQSNSADSITVQWCMVTESLNHSVHPKGDHGYGGIIGSKNQSYHHNLFAHHTTRLPKVSWRRPVLVDFRNNVIYNWQNNNCYDGADAHMNWVSNYYKYGPATKTKVRNRIFYLADKSYNTDLRPSRLYAENNFVWGFPAITMDNWDGGIDFYNKATREKNRAFDPFECPPIREQTPEQAFKRVMESVGTSMVRDAIDARIIYEVENGIATFGKAGIIDSPGEVKGWPEHLAFSPFADTDGDGLPDYWEEQYQFNPSDSSDSSTDADQDGYGQIEEYLNNTNAAGDEKPVVYLQTIHPSLVSSLRAKMIFCRTGDLQKPLTIHYFVKGIAKDSQVTRTLPGTITFQPGKEKVSLDILRIALELGQIKLFDLELRLEKDRYYIGCPVKSVIELKSYQSR